MDEGTRVWLDVKHNSGKKIFSPTYGVGRHNGIDTPYIWMLFGRWERDYLLYWY